MRFGSREGELFPTGMGRYIVQNFLLITDHVEDQRRPTHSNVRLIFYTQLQAKKEGPTACAGPSPDPRPVSIVAGAFFHGG